MFWVYLLVAGGEDSLTPVKFKIFGPHNTREEKRNLPPVSPSRQWLVMSGPLGYHGAEAVAKIFAAGTNVRFEE